MARSIRLHFASRAIDLGMIFAPRNVPHTRHA
jgi:hypothetical protein